MASLHAGEMNASGLWDSLLRRYPTIETLFAGSTPTMPIRVHPLIQHRLTRAAGERWALMPHAFTFVDPLFSTGIAWGLRAVERLALAFESARSGGRIPDPRVLARYESALAVEADQIDLVVAGAYEAMAHFDLFAAQAMLYFGTVSYAEVRQRLVPDDGAAWNGFLGVGDPVLEPLPRESLRRLRRITRSQGEVGTVNERATFAEWMQAAIAPRNVVGLADPARRNLYPVDLDTLIERHALLGLRRDELMESLPRLRGLGPEPVFTSA
jgi:FADH2 O2-dependent halogenase